MRRICVAPKDNRCPSRKEVPKEGLTVCIGAIGVEWDFDRSNKAAAVQTPSVETCKYLVKC